ncbi:MAG: hypothetical protein ACRBF0_22730 [Calditrichia bacterium]
MAKKDEVEEAVEEKSETEETAEELEKKQKEEFDKELQAIEKRLEKGDDLESSSEDISVLLKAGSVYYCQRCRSIYFRNKWIKDNITDMYLVRTELALCDTCLKENGEHFVSSLEIYDSGLKSRRKAFEKLARTVQNRLENRPPFEKVLNTVERDGVMYIFSNTTRLSVEISKELRAEYHGTVQYEWFERNQYLRARWYASMEEREVFADRIKQARAHRFGVFAFEDRF